MPNLKGSCMFSFAFHFYYSFYATGVDLTGYYYCDEQIFGAFWTMKEPKNLACLLQMKIISSIFVRDKI